MPSSDSRRTRRRVKLDSNKAVVIESELGYLFGVADRALSAGMTPDEEDLLRTFRQMLEVNGPPIMEAVAELEDTQHKPVFLYLLRTLQAAFMIGNLATRSDTGDKFVRREISDAARKAPKNSERQRVVDKAFAAAAAQWDGQHPAKKAEEIAADLARQGINKPKARAIYDRLKKLAVSAKDCNSDA